MITDTQNQLIKKHLEAGNSITPLEALEKFGCLRLGARIYDLRTKGGMDIKKERVSYKANGRNKSFAKYYLENGGGV